MKCLTLPLTKKKEKRKKTEEQKHNLKDLNVQQKCTEN